MGKEILCFDCGKTYKHKSKYSEINHCDTFDHKHSLWNKELQKIKNTCEDCIKSEFLYCDDCFCTECLNKINEVWEYNIKPKLKLEQKLKLKQIQ